MGNRFMVGIDIGGTSIKMGLLTPSGSMVGKLEQPTLVELGADSVIQRTAEMVELLLQRSDVAKQQLAGIGIGVPGPIDADSGVVHQAVNLHWQRTELRTKMEALTGVRVFVENDANAAALGEMWQGAGTGATNLVMITLGTGVGGGIIVNGAITHGINGVAGEIGHITVDPTHGPLCNCGKRGCLENYASATGIIRAGREAAENGQSYVLADILSEHNKLTAKDVIDAAKAGDPGATSVIDQAAYYLGLAFSHLIVLLNPAKIVVGGGVSASGPFLFDKIREVCQRFVPFPQAFASCDILPATLGNDAGIIGAAWLVRTDAWQSVT
ncbi:UNVERIFIED_CONTAM: glucokinase [Brevibacillus sp. OAP136]